MTEPTQEPFDILRDLRPGRPVKGDPGRVAWRRYPTSGRIHCYACVLERLNGNDVVARRATWVRAQDGQERMFCTEHASFEKAREEGVIE